MKTIKVIPPKNEIPIINRIAVFLAVFYAFSTRSLIGPIIYQGTILWVYYGFLFLSLGICLINSFQHSGSQVYAPKHFYIILCLSVLILSGLYRSNEKESMIYYSISLLLPFSITAEMKKKGTINVCFVFVGVILFIGCLINYLFPNIYNSYILPMYTKAKQKDILWQASFGTFFPGFTSQVGYTSFFLCVSFGALFCFRKTLYNRTFIIFAIIILFGIFLTGKRGPFLFLFISTILIYLIENKEKQKAIKLIQIIVFILASYFALYIIAKTTNNPGINRIFDSVQELVFTHGIEDVGREQLREQALSFFYDNMLFGIGWLNYKNLFTLRSTYVHNIYLQLLCETGIIGFSIFIAFFIYNIYITVKKIKQSKESQKYEYSWLMFSLYLQVFFLLYGISGNPLYDIEETIIYFFAIGICYAPMLTVRTEHKKGELYK